MIQWKIDNGFLIGVTNDVRFIVQVTLNEVRWRAILLADGTQVWPRTKTQWHPSESLQRTLMEAEYFYAYGPEAWESAVEQALGAIASDEVAVQ